MPGKLDVHEASLAEKLAAYRNVHESWGRGLPVEAFVAQRLKSPSHNRASWYVGTVANDVVTSMGWFPLALNVEGGGVKTVFGVGAVHTQPNHRGKGYAAELLRSVIRIAVQQGAEVGLLFSDITLSYYSQFGFVEWHTDSCVRAVESHRKLNSAFVLEKVEVPSDHIEDLARLYDSANRRFDFWLRRDRPYWEVCIRKSPLAEYYLLLDHKRRDVHGYARVRLSGATLLLEDYALRSCESELESTFFEHVNALGAGLGCSAVEGWLPKTNTIQALFEAKRREFGIVMLASFGETFQLERRLTVNTHFWMADYF